MKAEVKGACVLPVEEIEGGMRAPGEDEKEPRAHQALATRLTLCDQVGMDATQRVLRPSAESRAQ